jgi:hypothetical protein
MPRYKRKPKPPYVPKPPQAALAELSVPEPAEEQTKNLSHAPAEAPHVPLPKRIPARYKKGVSEKPPVKEPIAAPGHLPGEARRMSAKPVQEKANKPPAKPVPQTLRAKDAAAAQNTAGAAAAHVHGNPRRRVPEALKGVPAPDREGIALNRRDTAPFTLPAVIFEKEAVPEEWSGQAADGIPVMPVRSLSGLYVRDASSVASVDAPYPAADSRMSTEISRHRIGDH